MMGKISQIDHFFQKVLTFLKNSHFYCPTKEKFFSSWRKKFPQLEKIFLPVKEKKWHLTKYLHIFVF
jgi:hypothetical protein